MSSLGIYTDKGLRAQRREVQVQREQVCPKCRVPRQVPCSEKSEDKLKRSKEGRCSEERGRTGPGLEQQVKQDLGKD